ncbi:hypothetical protein AKO1_013624 [Acrasis kona]|uniref:Uncharacterized protein n=1 Tax=Acrasis kona TaxID=1008807 RepID=A0AAW2YV86_9EUKA
MPLASVDDDTLSPPQQVSSDESSLEMIAHDGKSPEAPSSVPVINNLNDAVVFEALDYIKQACSFMYKNHMLHFNRIMFEPVEASSVRRLTMTKEVAQICADMLLQSVIIARNLLLSARDHYLAISQSITHLLQNHSERCPGCQHKNAEAIQSITLCEASLIQAITVTGRFMLPPNDSPTSKTKGILKGRPLSEPMPKRNLAKDAIQKSHYIKRRVSILTVPKDRQHSDEFVKSHFRLIADDDKLLSMYDDAPMDIRRNQKTVLNRNTFVNEMCTLLYGWISNDQELQELYKQCSQMVKDAKRLKGTLSSTAHAKTCALYSAERKVMFVMS